MAEIINLASFPLDVQKLQTNLSDLQDTLFDLRKEQTAYANQSKDTAKQIDLLTKSQKALESASGDNTEAVEANQKELDALIKTQRDLFKSEQNLATQMGTVRKEINQTNTSLKAYQDAEGKTASLIDLGNQALGRQIKNKNEARAANIALNNVANQLNPNIEEENQLLIKLNAQMDKNTNFIKENSSETAKQKMNVGNYSSALEGLDGILAKFGINGQEARTVVEGFTSTVSKAGSDIVNYSSSAIRATASVLGFKTASQLAAQSQTVGVAVTEAQTVSNVALATTTAGVTVATTASTIGLKAFTIALAATGIGLIVIALGALFSYLKDLDPLLDRVAQGFAAVGAVVRVLGLAIANLSFDGLGESMSKAAKEAIALKEAQQGLADLQNSQEVANAKASQQYDELILKSKNRTLTEKERIDFLQQAEKIEEANYKQRSALAQAELNQAIKNAQIQGQLSEQQVKRLSANTLAYGTYLLNSGKITQSDLDQLKQAELGKISIDAESTKRLEKNQNAQDKLREDSQKAREKADSDAKERAEKETELALSLSRTRIEAFIAEQGFKRKSAEEEYSFNYALYNKEFADLKLQLQKNKITQAEFDVQMQQLRIDYLAKNAELAIENAEIELNAEIEKNARILDSGKFLSDAQLLLKQQALADNLKADQDYQKLRLEKAVINEQQYNAELTRINEENRIANEELKLEREAVEREKSLLDLENQKIINEDNFLAQAEIEKAQAEIKRQQEVANADQTGADISLINAKYAKIQEDIEFAKQQNKVKLASDAFGNLATIFGEESKAGKAAAIAQTTIDTYQSAISAFKSLSGIPIVGPILGGIAAGAAVASGLAAVKKITATKQPTIKAPSYASGVIGLRGAGTGTSDDVNANLSAGETVITAKATSMFSRELSAINQAGGGVGINGASNIISQNEMQNNVNNSQMARMVAEAVAIGAEAGTSKGAQSGIVGLSDNRKVMSDAKF